MDFKKFAPHLPVITLLLLIGIIAVSDYWWLSLNVAPPVDDEALHLSSATEFLRIFRHPSWDILTRIGKVDNLYPPLFPLVAAGIAFVSGQMSTLSLCMTNLPFFIILFFSLYFIGLKQGQRWLGVLAAMIFSLYPMVFSLGRMFMLEIALVSLVTLTMALLLYSEGFTKRRFSLWAGVSLGAALLTKQTAAVFVLGPSLFLLFSPPYEHSVPFRKRFYNFFLFGITGVFLALPWYAFNAKTLFAGMSSVAFDSKWFPETFSIASWDNWFYYLNVFVEDQVFGMFSLTFLAALIIILRVRGKIGFFLAWIIVPYGILSLIPNKFYYYTVSFLPAVALLTAYGLLSLASSWHRRSAILLVLFLGAFQYAGVSFMAPREMSKILHRYTYSPRTDMSGLSFLDIMDVMAAEGTVPHRVIGTLGARDIETGGRIIHSGASIEAGDAYIFTTDTAWRYFFSSHRYDWRADHIGAGLDGSSRHFPDWIVSFHPLEKTRVVALVRKQYLLTDIFEGDERNRVYLYKRSSVFDIDVRPGVRIHSRDMSRQGGKTFKLRWVREKRRWKILWDQKEIARGVVVEEVIGWIGKKLARLVGAASRAWRESHS